MKLEGKDINPNSTSGFVRIIKLDKAQQITLDINLFSKLVKLVKDLKDLGFSEITLTVEANQPLIIGGKKIGLALAPVYTENGEEKIE